MSNVEIFENERATHYNEFVEAWIPNYGYFMRQLPNLLHNIKHKNLLVVGCGTGNEIQSFIQSSKKWHITGVDPSPQMLHQAKELFKNKKNITLVEGLVSDLKVDEKFDAATLLLVLHFLKDDGAKLDLLKNIADRIKSGGTFILLDITGTKNEIKKNLQILKSLLPPHDDEEQMNNRLERIENSLFYVSEKRLSELLVKAGFKKPLRFFQSAIYSGYITSKI